MRAGAFASLVGLALLLAACAPLHRAAPASQDSMAAECPFPTRYTRVGHGALTLAELQSMAQARLGRLGLEAAWSAPEARAFEDLPEDRERLSALLSVVLPAYERYPRELFARVGLRRLELVQDLRVAGQLRRAMPAVQRDAVAYADIGDPPGAAICEAGIEARIHHELYHLIEARLFGDYYHRDPRWLALNPAGVTYGNGGASAYGGVFHNLGHPRPGFVSRYALYGPEEDKAEVFGWMMTPGYAARVMQWSRDDPALNAKREFMLALMQTLSQGRMAPAYLDALAHREAP